MTVTKYLVRMVPIFRVLQLTGAPAIVPPERSR